MLWVCFLGMIIFYIYAITGFLFLRNIFLGNQLYCHNMFECFVSTIRNGLMFGFSDVKIFFHFCNRATYVQ